MLRLMVLVSLCCAKILSAEESYELGWEGELGRQKESISKLVSVLGSEAFASEPQLFEGLPHQGWDKELLDSELKRGVSFTQHGFPFYKKRRVLGGMDRAAIKVLLSSRDGFRKYSGPKFCGGYHPDFMVRFKSEDESVDIHLCFGCGEARIYKGDLVIYCDLGRKQRMILEGLLEDYYLERPDKKQEVLKLVRYAKGKKILELVLPKKDELKKWNYERHHVLKDGCLELFYMSKKLGMKIRCD